MNRVFSSNHDIYKNAYMNWRIEKHEPIHNMNILAEGYFEGATLLINTCLADNSDHKADGLIFPILFSLNQAIELYVKSICWSLSILLGHKESFKPNHNILGIWSTAKERIKEFGFDYGREESVFREMIILLEKYLEEIYETIMTDDFNKAYHNIDFTRFPSDKKLQNHFYVNEYKNVVVDLENLSEWCENLRDCLSRLADTYYALVLDKWDKG